MSEFDGLTTSELLQLWSRSLAELRTRGICRSANNPVADYAELLSTRALGLTLAAKSNTGSDAVDGQGQRYEVKARRITPENRSRQAEPTSRPRSTSFPLPGGCGSKHRLLGT